MNLRKTILTFSLFHALAFQFDATAAPSKPSILLLIKDDAPVDVNILLKKDGGTAGAVGALTGGLGGLFVGAAIEARNKKLADELAAKLPAGLDRLSPVSLATEKLLGQKLPEFSVSSSQDQSLLSNNKPDFSKPEVKDFDYVFILTPSLSYQTSHYWKDFVISGLYTKLAVFESSKQKRIFQRQLFAPAGVQRFWKEAIEREQPLIDNLPDASERMATGLYFNLLRADVLHELCQGSPAEERFPQIKPILKRELKGFSFKRSITSGWKKLPSIDKYLTLTTEKGKDSTLNIVTQIDLLLPALEQHCSDVPAYLELQALLNPSLNAAPLDTATFPLTGLEVGWEAYSLQDSSTLSIAVFKIEGHYLVKHVLAADSVTPEANLKRGLPTFIQYINDSKFTLSK